MKNWNVVVEMVGGKPFAHALQSTSTDLKLRSDWSKPCHPIYHTTVPACTLNVPCAVRTIEFYAMIVIKQLSGVKLKANFHENVAIESHCQSIIFFPFPLKMLSP